MTIQEQETGLVRPEYSGKKNRGLLLFFVFLDLTPNPSPKNRRGTSPTQPPQRGGVANTQATDEQQTKFNRHISSLCVRKVLSFGEDLGEAQARCVGTPPLWGGWVGLFLLFSLFISTNSFSQSYDSCAFNGGIAGGQSSYSLDVVGNCSPAYTSVALGGIQDGQGKDVLNAIFCNDSILYSGGVAGGQSSFSQNVVGTCTPTYVSVALGGIADGHSQSVLNFIYCNDSTLYSGGVAGGQSSFSLNVVGDCSPTYATPFAYGGIADGAASDTIDTSSGCPTVSPICTILSAYAGEDVSICIGDSTQLDASAGGLSYSWTPTNGLSNPNIRNPMDTPTVTTTYIVTISDLVCSKKDTVVVTVNPLPTPSITGNNPICDGGEDLLTASGGFSYLWNTGSNRDTTTVSPSSSTMYTVTATTVFGCTADASAMVNVGSLPAANTGGDKSICPEDSVQLGVAAVGGNTYSWSPSTGLSSDAIANPKASPAVTTTYTLTETVTATGCVKSNSAIVTVNPLPAANVGVDKTICNGGSTTIGAAQVGTNTYSWSPATGLSSTTDPNPTANPTTTTTYTLTETITATGCTKSDSVIVNVNPLPAADVGVDKTICYGQSTTIGAAAVGGNTYSWLPITNLSDPAIANPTANPTASITYTLTETITATGCVNSNSVSVTVNPLPDANAGTDVTICLGDSAQIGAASVGNSYSWSPATGLSNRFIANPKASPASTTSYTLTETIATTGCQKSNSVIVTINPLPVADAGTNQTICRRDSTQLGATPPVAGNTYSWLPVAGLSSSTSSYPKASPDSTKVYTLTETITATGCFKSNSVTVTVNQVTADAGNDQTICGGQTAQIGAAQVGINTYSWVPPTDLSSSTAPDPIASPAATTTYTLTETNPTTGCSNSNSVTITVDPSATPDAITGGPQSICLGDSAQLGAAPVGGNTYSWSPTTGLSASNISNPKASPASTTTYTLTEVVTATGCSQSNTVTVTVNPLPVAAAGSNRSICEGGSTTIGAAQVGTNTYDWISDPVGFTSTSPNPTVTPATTTTYTVTETITATGCVKSNSVIVNVYPYPAADAGSPQTICYDNSVVIGAAPVAGSTYSWSPATRLSSTTVSNPTANPTATITYTLTETSSFGCVKSNTVTVTVNPLPAANAGSTQTICSGGSVLIGGAAVGGSTYSWTPAAGLDFTNISQPTASPATSTTYTVTETNSDGCIKSNSVTVFVDPPAYISGGGIMCTGSITTLIANGGCSGAPTYSWNTGPTTQILTINPVLAGTTTYTVTVTDAGGYSSVASVTVTGVATCTYASPFAYGGTNDGHSVNNLNFLNCNTGLLYAGGQAGGQASSANNYAGTCTPAYASVFAYGGNTDGHSMNNLNFLTCNTGLLYAGGQAGGQMSAANNYMGACTPVYASVALGGNADGHAIAGLNFIFCNIDSILYTGGLAGGQMSAVNSYAGSCVPAYSTPFAYGGVADGHSLSGLDFIYCNIDSILYTGGLAGGQMSAVNNYAGNCVPAYTSTFARGGTEDGHRLSTPLSYLGGDTCIVYSAPLPIELLDFTAIVISKNLVSCNWVTANEVNNDYFTVEKTVNIKDYFFVGEVSGAGNSTTTLSYSFPDEHPFMGTSYYRLKQTDFDGKYKYSQLVAVTIKDDSLSKTTVSIYPNPVTELLNVYMLNGENIDAALIITDVLGRVVYSQKSSFGEGINQFTISTTEYREGMYFLHILDANTNRSVSLHRFVKINEQ